MAVTQIGESPRKTFSERKNAPKCAAQHVALLWLLMCLCVREADCSPDPGKWMFNNVSLTENYLGVVKNVYANTELFIKVKCANSDPSVKIRVGWMVRKTPCWEEYLAMDSDDYVYNRYYNKPDDPYMSSIYAGLLNDHTVHYVKPAVDEFSCPDVIQLKTFSDPPQVLQANSVSKQQSSAGASSGGASIAGDANSAKDTQAEAKQQQDGAPVVETKEEEPPAPEGVKAGSNLNRIAKRSPTATKEEGAVGGGSSVHKNLAASPLGSKDPAQYVIKHEGVYLVVVYVEFVQSGQQPLRASVEIEMQSPSGYLSVADWPLLPFYGIMCGVYVLLGLFWLIVCSVHWRDLLRLQFWIGGVIFLGMVEKAMFTSEYQNINSTGQATQGLIVSAEIVSCAKRTLARMLVIIVSLGFGIVKPRLGPTMSKVMAVGGIYFLLASVESVLRAIHPKNDPSNITLMAAVPLAVIDASICWWVFSALIQTTRALRLRRNLVKLSVYKHFTNTLVFAVFASIIFMLWSIKYHKIADCLTDWRDLWVDEAFWHLLFSVILVVIMILWRPSQNNQRYAFTPLLDGDEDYSSDDEDVLYSDAWEGMKLRGKNSSRPDTPSGADPEEDPLAWVEENIAGIEPALPALDSEEEIETTKVEISKMM